MKKAVKFWALGLCAAWAVFGGLQAAFSKSGARPHGPIAEGGGVSLSKEYQRDSTFNKWSE